MSDDKARRPRVLCVDDEPGVLEGLELTLRKHYRIETASSGEAALAKLRGGEPFALVISDMRMPGMNGAELLAQARQLAPDTQRILLTGHSDVDAAVRAINEGQILRFLHKPCATDRLLDACAAAVQQHQLLLAERELLERTLLGSVRALVDLLAITHPRAFGRSTRVTAIVRDVAAAIGLRERWRVECAAMLSQIGCVGVDEAIVDKHDAGRTLDASEQTAIASLPKLTRKLLEPIPRLEPVIELIEGLHGGRAPSGPEASLLQLAVEFERLESRGVAGELALRQLEQRRAGLRDDTRVLSALGVRARRTASFAVEEVPMLSLSPGMVLAEDLHTVAGVLMVAKGYEITASFVARVKSFRASLLPARIKVVVRRGEAA